MRIPAAPWAALGAALTSLGLTQPAHAQPPSARELQQRVTGPLYDALRDHPALRGAWVTLERPGDRLLVKPAVDADRADAQTGELLRLLAALLPPGGYDVGPVERLPVSRLVSQLQDAADDDPLLQGALITGVYFDLPHVNDDPAQARATDRPDDRYLYILGRVPPSSVWATKAQRETRLRRLCDSLLTADPEWAALRRRVNLQVKTDLTEVEPSGYAGLLYYRDGVAAFNAGRYATAARLFGAALVEDPGNVSYTYWRALAEIGAGRTDRAYRLVRPLAQAHRGSYRGPFDDLALQPFERIQGPLRTTLHDLERRALTDTVTPSRAGSAR
jgi:hypothetical protein